MIDIGDFVGYVREGKGREVKGKARGHELSLFLIE